MGAKAEILLGQNRVRAIVATAIASTALLLRAAGVVRGDASVIVAVLVAYLVVVGAITASVVYGRRRAGSALASMLTLLDIAALFTAVSQATPPEHYPRALLVAMLALQYTHAWLGALPAITGIAGAIVAYLTIVGLAIARGAALDWGEEAWTLVLFAVAAANGAAMQRRRTRRLATLVELFGHAERGDFSMAYEEPPDARPDALTIVGRAYNQLRAQLASLVLTDPLTGCLNRRGFEQELQRYLARAARYGGEVALLAVDLDHFKKVNDQYGHLAGDAVLREIAALLGRASRGGDVIARLGGEEFALILPHTDGEDAGVVAERLMELVRAHRFRATKGTPVTVSVGIACEMVTEPTVAGALRARADEALYVAKRLGRNRVVLWAPGIRSHATPPWASTPVAFVRSDAMRATPV